VDMLKYKADAQNAYDMQVSQFEIGVEQLRMSGMENLANWIVETPTFSMDATPLMTLLSDLTQTQAAQVQTDYALSTQRRATKKPTVTGWEPSDMAKQGRSALGTKQSDFWD
ncbi:hypothetical protein LCGC14_2689680, partial [marine sediment metagenome]